MLQPHCFLNCQFSVTKVVIWPINFKLRGMRLRAGFGPCLLLAGVLLGVVGLLLWWLPFPERTPPFAVTALLCLAGGAYEIRRERRGRKS